MTKSYEQFKTRLIEAEESALSYATEHEDSGGNYLSCMRDGDTFAMRDRLRKFAAEHMEEPDLSEDELETLLDYCLDWSEAYSGHVFSRNGEPDYFHVDSWPVGEIETQYSFDDRWVQELAPGASPALLRAYFRKAEKEREICGRVSESDCLSYQTTDCVWIARVHRETLRQCLEEWREENPTTEQLFNRILHCNLFRLDGESIDLVQELENLAWSIKQEEETNWNLGECEALTLDSLIVGAYWALTECHEGQTSDSYRCLCRLGEIFEPGMASGPEPDSPEQYVYQAVVDYFTKPALS